jgi:ubiquinone/menaquinone biosynthesis C-methylase UbiE
MSSLLNILHTKLVSGWRVRVLVESLAALVPNGSRLLDIGCGDGQIAKLIVARRSGVEATGIDVLLRPKTHIPVAKYDGTTIPFEDASFDVVMFIDVLHHTENPAALLREATRVTRRYVLLKDHFRNGVFAGATLRLMDWIGNVHHGVALPYNYLSETEWRRIYERVAVRPVETKRKLNLYPQPVNLVFGRGLHFIALLEKEPQRQR